MIGVDFTRQMNKFDRNKFKQDVHIVGCGATGSWVALVLSKIGVKNINLYDFDVIEEHNIPNQFFSTDQLGKNKALALKDNCDKFCFEGEVNIRAFDKKVSGSDVKSMRGVVFVLTDTMESRNDIFQSLKWNANVPLIIETRMGLEHGRVYSFCPFNKSHIERYSSTLYTDEDASLSACGASQSIAVTAMAIASRAVWKLVKYHLINEKRECSGDIMKNEVLLDFENSVEMSHSWQ